MARNKSNPRGVSVKRRAEMPYAKQHLWEAVGARFGAGQRARLYGECNSQHWDALGRVIRDTLEAKP